MIHHIKRATRHLIFWSLIASAISLTVVRLLLLGIDHYKADISTRVSELVGAPVKIGRLRANMRGYNPELIIKDIEILPVIPKLQIGNERPAIQFKEIRLGINLLDVLVNRDRLASTWVTFVGAKLTVRRKQDGSIAVVGLKASDEQPLWLLQGSKYEVLQSEISWQDERSQNKLAVVGKVDFAIMNKAQQHQVHILVKLPKKYGNELRVSMDLTGNVFEPSAIDGAVFVEGKNLNIAEWMTLGVPLSMDIRSGSGDFKIWSELQHSQLVAMDGDVQLQRMKAFRQDNDVFSVKQLKTFFHWRLNSQQWRLDVEKFLLETADAQGEKKWPDAVFSVAGFIKDSNSSHKAAVFARQLDLREASRVAQFFAPLSKEVNVLLVQAQLKGYLEDFSLFADADTKAIAFNGMFTGLSVAPFSQVPGIDNLTGHIKGSEKAGILHFATENASITAPDFFREAFVIKSLKGNINWQQTDADWILSSPKFELNLHGLQSKNRLALTIPKTNDRPSFLDMQSAFVSEDISQAKHYFPTKVMKPADVVWFDNAFLGGRVTKGGLLYVGKLGVFPSKAGEGVFEALLDIDQLNLSYAPDWPQLSNIVGQVTILQKKMTCEIRQGQSNNLNILQATVVNPALGTSKVLTVKGELEGEVSHVFKFLQQTPLAPDVGFLVDAIVPQGNTKVALDLTLPLAEGIMPKVYGTARLNQASLNVLALDLGINKINGELKFTEQGVYSDAIKAVALGQPIKVNINRAEHQTFVNITGSAELDDLQKKFKMSAWTLAKGAIDYQLKLGLPSPGSPSELVIQSDLVGVALDLPGFLAKTKNQKKPLTVTISLGDEALLPIAINYNDTLKAAVKLNPAQQRIQSGHILIGSGEAVQPSETGLILEVNQDPLNLQDLLGLAGQQSNSSNDEGADNNIKQIKIHSQHAQWKNTPLGSFELTLKPDADNWAGVIKSVFATGKIALKGAEKITLDMTTVDLSALKQLKSQSAATKDTVIAPELQLVPAAMPLLAISSQKTLWQSVDLGQLRLETERIPNGMVFKYFELAGDDQKLTLSGDWKVNAHKSETHIQGNLNMPRAGQLLAKLGITKDLTESSADVDFTAAWNAAPYQFALADVKGKIDVNLKSGRILSIEPGFGRVLGVLAVAQWIKRLQLDFSDVYEEGLTFNSINGHFDLLKGKAITHDLVIDAIPAKITITGETDFVNQTLDQVVNVTPKSADAIPIAGTIVGKVTGLIGRSLTGKDQEGFFFGSQYLVKGDWGNAQIIPLHENDGLLQKTWNGITGFPWLQQPEEP